MSNKRSAIASARFFKVSRRKLQERSAVLYSRALERWNTRSWPAGS
jgi:hypothetical protein